MLTGFTGLFSFGHAGYLSIGAYGGHACGARRVPFLVALPFSGSGGLHREPGDVPDPPLERRLLRDSRAQGSARRSKSLVDNGGKFTGGSRDFTGIPTLTKPLALAVAALGLFFMRNIVHSRFGRSMIAIREDRLAAQSIGINVAKNQMASLAISAFYCGVAGGLFAFFMSFIQPRMFDMGKSNELAASVVFGGLGSLTGAVVAAAILTAIPELFRPLMTWRMVFYGLALVLMVLRPGGLLGTWELSMAGPGKLS